MSKSEPTQPQKPPVIYEEEEPDVISRLATTGKSCMFWGFWIPFIIICIIVSVKGCIEGLKGL